MGFGMIGGWFLFIVIIIALFYVIKGRKDFSFTENDAQEILDERYARGEIDEKE